MPVAVPFDTLEYARKLQEAGVTAPQAAAHARALADALSEAVATPSDLHSMEERLTGRIDALDVRLSGRIDALDARLSGRMETLDGRIDALDTTLGARIDKLTGSVETLKWLFGLVAALNIATFARLVIAS